MEFLPLSRRRSSARNVPSGEEQGETDVFAGYFINSRNKRSGLQLTVRLNCRKDLYYKTAISPDLKKDIGLTTIP